MTSAIHGSATADESRFNTSLKRASVLAAALLLTVLGLTFAPTGGPASAAEAIAQCSDMNNTGGLGLECNVTVVNNLNVATGAASSTVTLEECQGAANTKLKCKTTGPTTYDTLTSSVNQCNYAENGGGSTVVCTVDVTNNITGAASTGVTGATVNQCNGSGEEGTAPTLNCDPFPANVSGATITQCNGSANGGGASKRVTCTVEPSTMSAQLPVSINQCNNSANGGGSLVTCTASLTNVDRASSTTPTPKASTSPVAKNKLHDSKTDGFTHAAANDAGSPVFLEVGALLLAGILAAAFAATRIGARR